MNEWMNQWITRLFIEQPRLHPNPMSAKLVGFATKSAVGGFHQEDDISVWFDVFQTAELSPAQGTYFSPQTKLAFVNPYPETLD